MRNGGSRLSRIHTWGRISESDDFLSELTHVLISRKVLTFDTGIPDSWRTSLVKFSLPKTDEDFALETIRDRLRGLEVKIHAVQSGLHRMVNMYRLTAQEDYGIASWTPADAGGLEVEWLEHFASQQRLHPALITLLFDSVGHPFAANRQFISFKERKLTLLLADFLLRQTLVRTILDANQLAHVLDSEVAFSLGETISLVGRYDQLLSFSNTLFAFASEQSITDLLEPPSFTEIMAKVPRDDTRTFLDRVGDIAPLIVHPQLPPDLVGVDRLDGQKLIAEAAVVLRLCDLGLKEGPDACRRASANDSLARLMYHYICLQDSAHDHEPTLREAFEHLRGGTLLDNHFPTFKYELQQGKLPPSRSLMLLEQLQDIRTDIRELKVEGIVIKDLFQELSESIDTFLTEEVREELVRDLLAGHVLIAYMITVPGTQEHPPLMDVLDSGYVEAAVEKLSIDRPEFDRLIQLRKGLGIGTRVGVVPLGMPFPDFCDRLEVALKMGIQKYNRAFEREVPEAPVSFVIRVIPSEDFIRPLNKHENQEESPASLVKTLLLKAFTLEEKVAVAGMVQGSERGAVAVRRVLHALIDSEKTTLVIMAGKRLDEIADTYRFLRDPDFQRLLDQSLMTGFQAAHRTDVCVAVSRLARSKGIQVAEERVQGSVESSLSGRRNLNAITTGSLSKVLLSVTKATGDILDRH